MTYHRCNVASCSSLKRRHFYLLNITVTFIIANIILIGRLPDKRQSNRRKTEASIQIDKQMRSNLVTGNDQYAGHMKQLITARLVSQVFGKKTLHVIWSEEFDTYVWRIWAWQELHHPNQVKLPWLLPALN